VISFAALHRRTVIEIDRQLLARELTRIYDATHAAVGRARIADTNDTVYCYGTEAECEDFAEGLRGVVVRAITEQEQHDLARHKRAAWRVGS
jgi:hypothetical protein